MSSIGTRIKRGGGRRPGPAANARLCRAPGDMGPGPSTRTPGRPRSAPAGLTDKSPIGGAIAAVPSTTRDLVGWDLRPPCGRCPIGEVLHPRTAIDASTAATRDYAGAEGGGGTEHHHRRRPEVGRVTWSRWVPCNLAAGPGCSSSGPRSTSSSRSSLARHTAAVPRRWPVPPTGWPSLHHLVLHPSARRVVSENLDERVGEPRRPVVRIHQALGHGGGLAPVRRHSPAGPELLRPGAVPRAAVLVLRPDRLRADTGEGPRRGGGRPRGR